MSRFSYRAATPAGALRIGVIEGDTAADAMARLRRSGLLPIEAVAARAGEPARAARAKPLPRALLARVFDELAVMLEAGVPLDRALAALVDDIEAPEARRRFASVLAAVREGLPLSRAIGDEASAFPPMTAAMVGAGEADGRPAAALAKLALTLERAQALHTTLVSAAIYPAMLLVIAAAVIALMLLWVVPQFEGLFGDAGAALPPTTRAVLAVSRGARRDGVSIGAALIVGGWVASRWLSRPAARRWRDRVVLTLPQIGPLVAMTESARFVRVLASLVQGGVTLPEALAVARRSLVNTHMAEAVDAVARGLREGEGLAEPLAAAGILPKIALSYLRTGEQTAQLPLMLDRLADTLDRDVRTRVERTIGVLTPLITVAMGAIVAFVIASIMTAILGFDDLALAK